MSASRSTLRRRFSRAFTQVRGLRLSPDEVEFVYLNLIRLRHLERFGQARDWAAIRAYCPKRTA